ncbi:ADP-dependent glucokinase/phosphofructokinase [Athalassotoga saccharophila]|uniref:ADP-dependent glucokinase/phosphofructokinase n=1 Tax=Athalassotoga saccharophila TaxID=1441386 RepID=UPI00137A463F|nr:ADP-dependent glucokinase/phosphofructokinase [Athalassotoga saccharophila]BBJ27813.1 phosphofructokinase [Athalassotoga saccharophila]
MKIYDGVIDWGIKRARDSKMIALGFHSVIDGLVKVDPQKFGNLDLAIPRELSALPDSIKCIDDFWKGLIFSFVNGSALQLMIDSKEVYEWIMKTFGTGTLRLGGTSANMAKGLVPFPFEKILVYVYPLEKEIANLFPNSKNLFVVGKHGLDHPINAYDGEGIEAIHWIFEFSQGQSMTIKGKIYTCPRSNRFIASWNPVNSKLEVRDPFKSYVIEHAQDISHFLVSGFHIMQEIYPDGETVDDRIDKLLEFVMALREKNSRMKFHLEFASIRRDGVRKAVEEKLFSRFDSLGLNEVELSWVARDIGYDEKDILNLDVERISQIISKIMRGNLSRVHFHALGFYLLALKEGYNLESQKKALAFASLAAAQRAMDGEINLERFKYMLDIPEKYDYKEWEEDGIHFILFPTKVVPSPKITVGLGDTISSLGFVLG